MKGGTCSLRNQPASPKPPDDEQGKEHLCQNKTVTQGTYAGCDIYYLWIGHDEKEECDRKVGMVNFGIPNPGKVISEEQVQSAFGVFDLVVAHRMKVWVKYEGTDVAVQNRIMALALDEDLGKLIERNKEEFVLWIDLEPDDPAASAAKRLAALIRAVRAAEKGR